MRRYLVLTASALLGSLAAVGFGAWTIHRRNPPGGGPLPRAAIDLMLFEGCVIFYAVTYLVAQGLYRVMGDSANVAMVRDQSEFQRTVLHLLAGAGMLGLGVKAVIQWRADPAELLAAGLGAVLVGSALPRLLRRRSAQSGS